MKEPEAYEVEVEMSDMQRLVDRRDKLIKLKSNREFRSLISEHYLRDEPVRLTNLMASSTQAKNRDELTLELLAIGKLDEFFRGVVAMGNHAEALIKEHLEMMAEEEAAQA